MIGKVGCLAAAWCALVSASPISLGTMNSDMPPERFRGNTGTVLVTTDRAGIDAECGVAPPGYVIIACRKQFPNGVPVIFMPNPCLVGDEQFYAKILCHELGHVNGWSGEHEA